MDRKDDNGSWPGYRWRSKNEEPFFRVDRRMLEAFFLEFPHKDKTLAVWMAIVNQTRVTKSRVVTFEPRWWTGMGVRRRGMYRALGHLEERGFIRVERQRGRSPTVTVLINTGTAADKQPVPENTPPFFFIGFLKNKLFF